VKRQRKIAFRRENKFAVIADSTPMAMMMHQDDRWLYINRAAETIAGHCVRELRDMHFLDDAQLHITYIKSHSEANFSHGLCPECIKRLNRIPGRMTPDL